MTHRVLGSPDEDPDANSMSRSKWGRIVWNQEQSGTLGGLPLGPILTRSGPSHEDRLNLCAPHPPEVWMGGRECPFGLCCRGYSVSLDNEPEHGTVRWQPRI
jgi:hypothetical protein